MSSKSSLFISLSTLFVFIISLTVIAGFLIKRSTEKIEPQNSEITQQPSVQGETTEEALVTRVIDGDTIEIETGEKVRYIGIDTPEDPRAKSAECFALESYFKNQELVLNKRVRLEKDISETDRFGRLLRYVWVNDSTNSEIFVNYELVNQGYAKAATYPPDVKFSEIFTNAQNQAMNDNLGLWGKCDSQLQTESFDDFINEIDKILNFKIQ